MIELQNIKNISKEDLVNLILDEKEQPLEIYAPKYSQQFFSEREAIAYDYLRAAYVGQKLSEISEEFKYENVPPTEHESILFEIKCSNIDKLAELLLELSYHFENDCEDEFIDDNIWQYLDDIKSEKVSPVCEEMIEIYDEFAENDEDEEDNNN